MSITNLLFGSTTKNAKREALDYDPTEGGRQKDLGDYLGDFFTGQGASLDEATKIQYVKDLKSKFGNNVDDLNKYGLSDIKITGNTTRDELDQLIKKHSEEIQLNKAVDQKAALAGYKPVEGSSYQDKLRGLRDYEDSKVGSTVETALFNRGVQQQQAALQMQQLEDSRLDRRADRRMENRRIDLQDARDQRKSQREMMMMIIAGLDNIGKGLY